LCARARDELADEPVPRECGRVRVQIFVHDEFLEGKEPQVHVGLDGPPLLGGDGLDGGGEEGLHIIVVRHRTRVRQVGEYDPEAALQVFRERRIDQRVIIGGLQHVPCSGRPPRQFDGHQDQRRLERHIGIGRLRIVQHPEREEQGVHPLLIDDGPRLLLNPAERLVQLFGRRAGLQHVVGVTGVERLRFIGGEIHRGALAVLIVDRRRFGL
jgi:hypothetical protein